MNALDYVEYVKGCRRELKYKFAELNIHAEPIYSYIWCNDTQQIPVFVHPDDEKRNEKSKIGISIDDLKYPHMEL